MRVGFIGIGSMGWPMAANLVKKGFDVAVFDMTADSVARFAQEYGCRSAKTFLDMAENDVLVTMLPTGPIVRKVLMGGENGRTCALRPGTVVIDMSSSEPVGTQKLGAELAESQVTLIDAPVSGGVPRAQSGTLAIMIGTNDFAALERVRPVLLAMGDRLFETGPLGCGHAMKALNNYVAAAAYTATAEALLIGERFGLDPTKMIDILNVSTGRNFSTDAVFKQHVLEKKFASGFKVGLLAKDVKIAAGLSEEINFDAPVLKLVCERWQFARDRLGEGHDHSEAILAWDNELPLKAEVE